MPLPAEETVANPAAAVADQGQPPPAAVVLEMAGTCNIESIDGLSGPALDAPVRVAADAAVTGWRAHQADDGAEAPAWLRVLGQDGNVVFQIPLAATVDRPDVAEAVGRAGALRSGFGPVKVTALSQGDYTLEVVLNAGANWVRCPHTRQVQVQ